MAVRTEIALRQVDRMHGWMLDSCSTTYRARLMRGFELSLERQGGRKTRGIGEPVGARGFLASLHPYPLPFQFSSGPLASPPILVLPLGGEPQQPPENDSDSQFWQGSETRGVWF